MIIGAHVMVQSTNDEADKVFFRDVLGMPNVDAGGGFMLFGVPPTEIAVHQGEGGAHELFLMCDDVDEFIADMRRRDIYCSLAQNRGWGIITHVTLPSGGRLSVYQPLHERPQMPSAGRSGKRRKAKAKAHKSAARKSPTRSGKRTAKRAATPRRGRSRKTR